MVKKPKLRTVDRYVPPYPLNRFPKDFHIGLGREIVYLLATRVTPRLEGPDWEEIFTRLVGGRWKPTNVGLDDVLLEQTAWSAKTAKATTPSKQKRVRLISGRNSPAYSYDAEEIRSANPDEMGEMILGIWNSRVSSVRAKYEHLRTVVLLKAEDLLELAVFEVDTKLYMPEVYEWSWNKNKNLVGICRDTGEHCFTWQPHGSQFTIIESVPKDRVAMRIKQPPPLDRDKVLETMDFDSSWVELIK